MSSRHRDHEHGEKRVVALDQNRTVVVRIVKQFGDTIRIDIEESRRWRIDVKQYGGIELIASWNSDGKLDDVPLPGWLPDLLHRLGLQGVVVE